MNNFYLLDYLKKNKLASEEALDFLKFELDQRIYYYGDHFNYPKEKEAGGKIIFQRNCKFFLKNIYAFCVMLVTCKNNRKKIVLSNAYFSINKKLQDIGMCVARPMHSPSFGELLVGNYRMFIDFLSLDKKIKHGNFNELLSKNFLKKLDLLIKNLSKYYKSIDVSALIVPNDISFYEQLNIKIFKNIGKPSFIFLHGLPGRYNIYDENQTDYLVVWGERIRQHYINIGFNPEKILVSGHPFYESLSSELLRNDFDNILIVTKSLNGSPHRDGVRLTDRGGLIVYLKQVEITLTKLGVKKVRLRVHPSENIDWYFKFINKDFFVADKDGLADSLKKATLVIGPTSSVFLEAIYYGVNYLVYEPVVNGVDISGYPPVPPFDGSDPKVPVAQNENDLERMLKEKVIVDKTIFNDYIDTPFNINCIIERI